MRSLSNLFVFLLISAFFACKNDTADKKTTDTPVGPETFMTKDVKLPTESDKVKYLNADDFDKYVQNNPNIPIIDLRAPEDFAKVRIDATVGAGFDLLLFSLDAGYNFGLSNVFSDNYNGKAHYAFVNLGLKF